MTGPRYHKFMSSCGFLFAMLRSKLHGQDSTSGNALCLAEGPSNPFYVNFFFNCDTWGQLAHTIQWHLDQDGEKLITITRVDYRHFEQLRAAPSIHQNGGKVYFDYGT